MIRKITLLLLTAFLITACDKGDKSGAQGNWYDALPRESWSKFEKIDTGQNWFEVYKLTDNTYAIYEPYQWQEAISYLLIGSEKAMLVDTLQGIGNLKAVTDKLTNLPIIVMNTHSHYDHVSGNWQYDTIYGVSNPYTLDNTKGHSHEEMKAGMTPDTVWKNLPDTFSFDTYESKPYNIDKFVEDGEIIDIGGRPIEVVYTPGHSPDSVILVDKQNRMMFTGDSFYPAPIYLYSEKASFEDFFISAQIMFDYHDQVDYLMPGHNETMQPAAYLNKLRQATMDIINPSTRYIQGDKRRTYQFDGFSIIVKDPLDFGIR
ncbi:MAG: MBL fold metallo-hydrolase [Alphaproteobacteria bacterium]|nr:MBL fold metallo-hydrolase [Alphaproteobacteria bacterium]HRW30657.1 MBL fold metallo-hydrolase [Emcibacteraceae bacterium]